jgi:hypothetical protein
MYASAIVTSRGLPADQPCRLRISGAAPECRLPLH